MKLLLCCLTVLSCALGAWSLTTAELAVIAQYNPNVTYSINNRKGTLKFISKALPHYPSTMFADIDLGLNDYKLTVNKDPTPAPTPGCLGSATIAMTINGVPIFRPYTSKGLNALTVEYASFDVCQGHTSPQGRYHYHGVFDCLVDPNQVDQLVGVADDGYPIYGPYDANGEITKDDLDDCQGRTENVNGQDFYRYRMTNAFPYTLGCFHGTIRSDNSGDNKCLFMNDCGETPGRIADTDPLYSQCGGGFWQTGRQGAKRSNIEAKIEAIEEMHEAAKKELQEEITAEDNLKAETQEESVAQIEGKRAFDADVAAMRRSFAEKKTLKSGANVKSSAARQMAQDDGDHSYEDERDLTGEVVRGLMKVLKELKDE